MAKLIVQNHDDPGIAIVISDRFEGTFEEPLWQGACTECGWDLGSLDYSLLGNAVNEAEIHVDSHEAH